LEEEEIGGMVQIALKHVREDGLATKCVQVALGLVIDPEVRIRLAVGECLGGATAQLGPRVWETSAKPILEVINYCWVNRILLPPLPLLHTENESGRGVEVKCGQDLTLPPSVPLQ